MIFFRFFTGLFSVTKNRLRSESGVVAVEFSFLVSIFLFLVFITFEIIRYVFISAVIDFSLSDSARISSINASSTIRYETVFKQNLLSQSKSMVFFIDEDKLNFSISYCDEIKKIINNKCQSGISNKNVLAIYKVSYAYQPIIFSGLIPGTDKLINSLRDSLSRQLVYIQEYEKNDEFKDS